METVFQPNDCVALTGMRSGAYGLESFSVMYEDKYGIEDWYREFAASEAKPVDKSELGSILAAPEHNKAAFFVDGKFVEVSTTKYSYANLQVGNEYYHIECEPLEKFMKLAEENGYF